MDALNQLEHAQRGRWAVGALFFINGFIVGSWAAQIPEFIKRLGITEATVKVHLKTLLRKIDVNNRTQAAIWAMNNGIIPEQSMNGDMPATRRLQAVSA